MSLCLEDVIEVDNETHNGNIFHFYPVSRVGRGSRRVAFPMSLNQVMSGDKKLLVFGNLCFAEIMLLVVLARKINEQALSGKPAHKADTRFSPSGSLQTLRMER